MTIDKNLISAYELGDVIRCYGLNCLRAMRLNQTNDVVGCENQSNKMKVPKDIDVDVRDPAELDHSSLIHCFIDC